jgi:hypothetical protein
MSADTGKDLFRLGFLTAIEIPERGYIGGLLVTNQFGRPLEFQCTAPLKPNRTQEILYGPTLVPYVLGDLIGRTLIEKVGVKPHLVLTERQELLGLRELVEIPVACVDEAPTNGQKTAKLSTEAATSTESETAPATKETLSPEEPIAVEQPAAESRDSAPIEVDAVASEPNGEAAAPVVAREALDALEPKSPRSSAPKLEVGDCSIQLGRQVLRFHQAHAGDRSVASRGARVVPNNADLREPFERVREALGETARMGGTR